MSRATDPPEKLLDFIYDAATEPELWPSIMRQIADLLNSQSGILFGVSMAVGGISELYFEHNGGTDEGCNRAHQERHLRNPWSAAMYIQPVERVVFSDEVFPLRSLRRTSFYDEVLRPQDLAHNAMISLAARADFRVAFNIGRSDRSGPFEEGERQILSRIIPHLRRSL